MMAHGDKVKRFVSPDDIPDSNTDNVADALAPSLPDISGVESTVQKVLSNLIERVMVLEAKTANMPLARPMVLPQKENYNTDFVAGM
jgi:hypothetical protein